MDSGKRPLSTLEAGVILMLDEIVRACRACPDDRHGTAVRVERQYAMLGLVWGGTPVRLKNGQMIRTDQWIVVACGAIAPSRFVADHRPPTEAELIDLGMSAELASRLPTRFALTPHSLDMLIELLETDPRGVRHARYRATSFGFTLEIPRTTLARLAVPKREHATTVTLRAASQQLCEAVVQLILAAGPKAVEGSLILAPGDLALPGRSRNFGTEPEEGA